MTAVLLDTHVWAWSLNNDRRLTESARNAIREADAVYISPISIFEIGQKVRIGKWPEMNTYVAQLPALIDQQGALVASLLPNIALGAATMTWNHRDPFDRLLASTAISLEVPLISADVVFDDLAGSRGWKERRW